jgi:DNA mismatch repair protein MutS
MSARHTPVMQQHAAAKRAYPDAIVFFRLGDFYEMFGDDAVLASSLLDLTLTSRNKGKPDEVPMAGVPHHAAHGYVARLLELGHKVALCEQMADPSKVKGIVPREVVRVVTPGLITDGDHLNATTNNWLATLELGAGEVGIALLDLSTGELRAARLETLAYLLGELSRSSPREILVGGADEAELETALTAVQRAVSRTAVRADRALEPERVDEMLGELAADAARVEPVARRAAARALRFALECNPGAALPVRRLGHWDPRAHLVIDPTAQAHLEIVDSAAGRSATLLGVIDASRTPAGARLLRARLLAPLLAVERIRRRLDMVELFVQNPRLRDEFRSELRGVGDLERLVVRASLGEATPRDLGALRDGLFAAERGVRLLEAVDDPGLLEILGLGKAPLDTVADLAGELETALVERPPAQPKDGGVFRRGYDAELDELDSLRKSGAERMVELEARLREETGIGTLKVRFTRVFGWYIEVSRSQAGKAPSSWRRKQTVASGERYTTDELDDLADRIANAEERHRDRELGLLRVLIARAAEASERVREVSHRIARWDVAAGLAEIAHRYDYTRPAVDESDVVEIHDGRHPVVERLAAEGRFVPNDVLLDIEGERLWLITGPNMAGKSTLLRQVALITILAQMGSYVPARDARIGLVDRVLSRVGASDNLARGQSTFMVEMRETAEILRSATRRSLVILDEIGRGTSTFDGLAIAWAVADYLDAGVGCRALFATHYHELTALADGSAHAANYSVSARELGEDVVFLHRLVRGAASQSYGVAVAKLAGLPESVLARARALLATFERGKEGDGPPGAKPAPRGRKSAATSQLDLFRVPSEPSPAQVEIADTLRALDVDRLTPLEALQLVARLKQRLQ